ncbi:ATP-binding protein [Pedobacter sp. P351]|uniref:ATP-binding protein n=1 Tax=Pedobacter superstes TaxID=3133441 RepID=UPI0030A389F1
MEKSIQFYNWSLKKLLETEANTFIKARIKILFVVLIFPLIKLTVAIPVAWHHHQYFHLQRAVIMLVVYLVLLKVFLINKAFTNTIAHVMVWLGLLIIWTNAFVYAQTINIVTLQFIFMLVLSSFYLLNKRFGIVYSLLGTLPVVLHLIMEGKVNFIARAPNELASPGFELIVVLNFITIIITHYLFQQAFVANIAEKEVLNKQLQLAVIEANHAAVSKSNFLSTMSHELRTPLNSVIGISELLLLDSKDQEQEENLKILKFSAMNLHSLVNDILDFNKLESDKLDLETIPVNLFELINEVCSGLRFQATKKGIDFILDVDEEIKDQFIVTDPTRITQIIFNLAGNAIKFTETGYVSVSLKALGWDKDKLSIRFSITDTGIGISADKKEAIFEPFTQASSSTTRNFGGTGLGLSIVKRLLYLFKSKIKVESTLGLGSTFCFDISFELDKEPVGLLSSGMESEYDLAELKVLVAEDNTMNRLLLTKVFTKWNNKPVFAMNGLEAIEKIKTNDFDVVLMDLNMPLVDGFEASKTIRDIADPVKSSIPIIALTASVSVDVYDKIKEAGMDDFILKPFKLKELYLKLKEITLKA